MSDIDLDAIEARYGKALDAKPSKGYIDPAPLWDSVCDIPDLIAALRRHPAVVQADVLDDDGEPIDTIPDPFAAKV